MQAIQKAVNRRQALHSVAALGLSGCTSLTSHPPGWIDAHSHIWTNNPDDLKKFPLAPDRTIEDLDPPHFTAEDLITLGKTQGVTRHVLISHQRYHGFSNNYYIHAAKKHPGIFAIVGALDFTKADIHLRMKVNRSRHITGYRITPNGNFRWLEQPGLREMWRVGSAENIAMCPLIDPQYVVTLSPMCKSFPDTPVVIDHCARIDAKHNEELIALCNLAKHRNVHVKISAFYAFGTKEPPYIDQLPRINRLLEAYGPERLMWASDCPYQLDPPNTYAASIALVRDRIAGLSSGDREHLLQKTAEKVYFT